MSNPWKSINLDDYEGHMNLESVKQLPVLRMILKSQLESYKICFYSDSGQHEQ